MISMILWFGIHFTPLHECDFHQFKQTQKKDASVPPWCFDFTDLGAALCGTQGHQQGEFPPQLCFGGGGSDYLFPASSFTLKSPVLEMFSFPSRRVDKLFLRMEITNPCYTDRETETHNLRNLSKLKVLMTWFIKCPGLLLPLLLFLSSPDKPFFTHQKWVVFLTFSSFLSCIWTRQNCREW